LLPENVQKQLQGTHPDLLASYQAFISEVAMRAFNNHDITLNLQEAKGLSAWVCLNEYAEEEAKKEFADRQKQLQAKLKDAPDSEKEQLLRRSLLKEEDYVLMKAKAIQQVAAELPMKLRGEGTDKRYEYSHKSLFEYGMAKWLLMLQDHEPKKVVKEGIRLLNSRKIQEEREAFQFLEEGWSEKAMTQLPAPFLKIITQSRKDKTVGQASANAATLLAAVHVPFSGKDLMGVRIKGADLSNAVLNYTCLYKADLEDVGLHR